MELIAAVGGGAFVLASLVLGARLMLLSIKTRGLPEFTLGAALFLMGGIGYPLMAVAQQATELDQGLRHALIAIQMMLSGVGMWGIAFFTRRVFRPTTGWALLSVVGIAGGYLCCALVQLSGPGLAGVLANEGPWFISTYLGIATMLWAATESFSYFRMLRKRMAIGLADAVTTDRFRLWSLAIYSSSAISVIAMLLQNVFGLAVNGTTVGHLVVGPLGLFAALALWLAFLPPDAYLRRVERRAAAHAAA